MFYAIPMVTAKISIKHIQKKNEKEIKACHYKKNQWKTKEGIKRGKDGQNNYNHIDDKQNVNSKSFPISNYFKCKWIKLHNQMTERLNEASKSN